MRLRLHAGTFGLTYLLLQGLLTPVGTLRATPAHAAGNMIQGTTGTIPTQSPASPRSHRVHAAVPISAYGRLPLSFEVNQGQSADRRVAFLARGAGYTLFLTGTDAVLALATPARTTAAGYGPAPRVAGLSVPLARRSGHRASGQALASARRWESVVRLHVIGANPRPRMVGLDRLPGTSNYFLGHDPRRWRTGVPTYGRVAYRDVYPGIDLIFYGTPGRLEYDWALQPGADARAIRFAVQGAGRPRLDRQGSLLFQTSGGLLRQRTPLVYQQSGGRRHLVSARYSVTPAGQVGVTLGAYDTHRPLIIDPILSYATYLGGSSDDMGYSIAVDGQGNAYIAGDATSTDFPTTIGAYSTTYAGNWDAFVSKLNASGTALVYSTYLGGNGGEDGYGVAVDAGGDAYVTGDTSSTDFPTTSGAYARTYGGGANDAYVARLNATGSALLYSTYLGGGDNDIAWGIGLDSSGNAYVAGQTASTAFPTTTGAYATVYGGGPNDGFVAKLNPQASGAASLVYSTYLGGSGDDFANGIAVDGNGNANVAGQTGSSNYPTTSGAYATTYAGATDAFITKLNSAGSALVYSTYLGGSGSDYANGIAVDGAGNTYVAGTTLSSNFPVSNAAQSSYGGGSSYGDAFVSKLNSAGSALAYSTYLGGSGDDDAWSIAVDANGSAYVTGQTNSTTYPVQSAVQGVYAGGAFDAFVSKLTPSGGALAYSSYLGGGGEDDGHGVAVDGSGNIYVTGQTNSTTFPTATPLQGSNGGGGAFDAFVAKIAPATSGLIPWHPHQTVRLSERLIANVDLADGHLDLSAPDVSIPGRGPAMVMSHMWDSALAQSGITTTAGQGWVSSLTPHLSGALTGTVNYQDASGAVWPFTYTGSLSANPPYTAYNTTPGLPWQLSTSTAGYTLTNILNGEVLSFNSQGALLSDKDAYGNSNTLTWGPSGPITETNSGSRTLSFAYQNGRLSDVWSLLWLKMNGVQGRHIAYAYNNAGQLSTLTYAAGTSSAVTSTFGYSGTQLVTVTTPMTSPANQAWLIAYDSQGRVVSLTSPVSGTLGQGGYTPAYTTRFLYTPGQTQVIQGYGTSAALTTTYTLDAAGEATAVADGLGDTTQSSYDQDHDVLSATDANNHTVSNAYQYVGPNGNVGLVTQTVQAAPNNAPGQATTRYSYNSINDLIERDSPLGGITRYGYDSHHSVITTTTLLTITSGNVYAWRGTVNSYDQYGERLSTVDGRGVSVTSDASGVASLNASASLYTHSWTYRGAGDVLTESTPPITTTLNGITSTATPVTTTYGYSYDGDLTQKTAPNGGVTTYSYDYYLGHQIKITYPQVTLYTGAVVTPYVSMVYDPDGNLVRDQDQNGNATTYSYDPLGRQVAAVNRINGSTYTTYSATQKVSQQDAVGNVTTYSYDGAGRLFQVTDPLSGTTQYQYDPVGNTTVITQGSISGAIQVETRGYDARSEVVSDTIGGPGVSGQTTTTTYDADGTVTQTTAPSGDITANSDDLADETTGVSIVSAGGTSSRQKTYSYDGAGNQYDVVDFDGHDHRTSFDGANRAVLSTDSIAGTPSITTSASFDPDGNVIGRTAQTVVSGGQVQTHTYSATVNGQDWLTSTSDDGQTTNNGYDAAGMQHTQTVFNGTTPVTSTLNAEGLATALTENAGGGTPYTSTFSYNGNELPLTTGMPNGTQDSVTYDANSRLTHLGATGPTGVSNPLSSSYDYGYNAVGWTTGITTTLNGGAAVTQTLTYNPFGPLIRAQDSAGNSLNWVYDGDGNLTAAGTNGITTTYSYNPSIPNEVQTLSTPGQNTLYYAYDQNGNTTSITNGAAISTSLSYDSQTRLSGVTLQDGTVITMTYTTAGQRASYTVSKGGSVSLSEQFQYVGAQLGQVVVVSGTQSYTDTYLYTQGGAPLELLRANSSGAISRYWYVVDGRGNVVALTDSSGNVVDRYSYDVWGAPTSVSESVPQQLRYGGYWYDNELGWYWLSVRSYDPVLKRWLQPDPSQQDGVRTYVYVGDDPVDAADPTGLVLRSLVRRCTDQANFKLHFMGPIFVGYSVYLNECLTQHVLALLRAGAGIGTAISTICTGLAAASAAGIITLPGAVPTTACALVAGAIGAIGGISQGWISYEDTFCHRGVWINHWTILVIAMNVTSAYC